jgi:AraC-like DNA-binding protein
MEAAWLRELRRQIRLEDLAEAATGFADASHLSKAFRRQVGTSPKAWQRQS